MLDALMFEERGVPGIAVVTEPFRETGRAMATTWGLPGFRFLDVPHPIANLGPGDLDVLATGLVPRILQVLAGREGA